MLNINKKNMKGLYCATLNTTLFYYQSSFNMFFHSIHTMNFIKFIKQTFKMLFFFIHVLLLHLFFAEI
jgi:hypothetical protein